MLFGLHEILDLAIMTALIGWLFKDAFVPRVPDDVLKLATRSNMSGFKQAAIAVAPAIIIHDLTHKFIAMSFGLNATFHAFYASTSTLILGILAIVAKLTGWGFVFLVPGYVSIQMGATQLQSAIIAFGGPAIHLIFWLGASLAMRRGMFKEHPQILAATSSINKFLFILNMLPIPGIDGWWVYSGLYHAFL
ncbi:MAG: hypothetical protein ABIH41_07410 [Nanoarchaeota archaeon]